MKTLNAFFLKKLLGRSPSALDAIPDERTLEALECPLNQFTLLKEGGRWLAAAREWLQSNSINGDRVARGSEEQLRFSSLSVRQFEELTASIAAAAIQEFRGDSK